jgi:hypothetical protein
MNIASRIERLARRKLLEQKAKSGKLINVPPKKTDDKSKKTDDKSKKPEKKITAKIGRGRVKAAVEEAGALARKDPKKLMKNLGVDGDPDGDTTEEKVLSLIRTAIYGNEVMQQAYTGAREVPSKEEGESKIAVTPRDLDIRSATKYMQHTLIAASRAGYLTLDKDVEIQRGGGVVLIQFT